VPPYEVGKAGAVTQTTSVAAATTVEERLARLERGLAALTAAIRMASDGSQCRAFRTGEEPQPEEERTTAGADALAFMDRHHPVAPAASDETQETT